MFVGDRVAGVVGEEPKLGGTAVPYFLPRRHFVAARPTNKTEESDQTSGCTIDRLGGFTPPR